MARDTQAYIRFGKYVITQIPLNVVVGELTLNNKTGVEQLRENSKSFHGTYEQALENLCTRMIKDGVATPQIDMVKTLKKSIEDAKEEIIKALKENPFKI